MSEVELHEMMRDPRYWRDRDPEFIRRVTDGFRCLFADAGGDETTDPAAEIATLQARVAELEASQARLAAACNAHSAYLVAMVIDRAAPDSGTNRGLAEVASALRSARRALTESDLAPEAPHG